MARILILRWAAAGALWLFAPAAVFADADRGADSFDANCAECHSVAKTLKNKKGPTLFGVVGRNAASVSGFNYSDAMKAAGYAWDRQRLDGYITAPKRYLPGGKMKFDGLDDAQERADLIDFLEQQR
jgi:cytochrome c